MIEYRPFRNPDPTALVELWNASLPGPRTIPLRTATHRYLHMNVKKAPFTDVRVRQAIALALNRPEIVQGLWGKYAEVGNDSPMWPGYAFTDKSVTQRKQDLEKKEAEREALRQRAEEAAQTLPR